MTSRTGLGMSPIAGSFGGNVQKMIEERAQAALQRTDALPSPCISLCQMDDQSGLCLGCFRDIDEICRWSAMGEAEKRRVWSMIEQRAAAARGKP